MIAGTVLPATVPATAATAPPAALRPAASLAAASATPNYPGSPPLWVQMPYLQREGKRFVLRASAYIDPSASNRAKRLKDTLTVKLLVAKPGKSTPKKPRALAFMPRKALLQQAQRRVTPRRTPGVQSFRFTFDKKVSRALAGQTYRQRLSSIGMSVVHRRDTEADSPHRVYDLRQVTPAELVTKALPPAFRTKQIRAIERQIRRDRRRSKGSSLAGGQLARWAGESPMYNQLNIANSSPFTQMVNINPNIQCMWTGADPSAALYTSEAGVVPGETVTTTYVWTGSASVWAGLQGATTDMNAPGTASTLTKDLANAAVAAGQSGLSTFESSGFNEAGVENAVGAAAGTFIKSMFTALNSSTCNDVATYPELFGVTTTVTGYGTNNVQDPADASWPAPSTWSGRYSVGSAISPTTTPQGSCSSSTAAPPSGAPNQWCGFIYGTLAPMMGATTQAAYYWNGGQPAYMVSNNASSGSYTGGAASFQGGLFQNAAPNPGSPGTAWCNDGKKQVVCDDTQSSPEAGYWGTATYDYGVLNIQVSFLSTPDRGSNGIVTTGTPTVSAAVEPSGGVDVLQLTCTFDPNSMSVALKLPFGEIGGPGTSQDLHTTVNTTNSLGGQASMNWAVSFYGVDDDGNLVYDADSVTGGSPTQPVSPNLGPGTGVQIVGPDTNSSLPAGGSVSVQIQSGSQWVTLDNNPTTPVSWGCAANAMATFKGVNIATPAGSGGTTSFADFFGTYMGANNVPFTSGWPMPGNHYGWPVGTQYAGNTNYSWQWPVIGVNVSYAGLSVTPVTLAATPAQS